MDDYTDKEFMDFLLNGNPLDEIFSDFDDCSNLDTQAIPCKIASTSNENIFLYGNPMERASSETNCSLSKTLRSYQISYKVASNDDANENLNWSASSLPDSHSIDLEVLNSHLLPCKMASTNTDNIYLNSNPMLDNSKAIVYPIGIRLNTCPISDDTQDVLRVVKHMVSEEDTFFNKENCEIRNKLLHIIQETYIKSGPVSYFNVLCDPNDYQKTLKNMYHLSLLIAEQKIMLRGYNKECDDLVERIKSSGSILMIDKGTWESIISEFNITEAMI